MRVEKEEKLPLEEALRIALMRGRARGHFRRLDGTKSPINVVRITKPEAETSLDVLMTRTTTVNLH